MSDDKIIAIKSLDTNKADEAFEHFMSIAQSCLNHKAGENPDMFSKLSPSEVENVALMSLKEVAPGTLFRPEEIKLVSGQRFPDIVAERYFGVEVKSTIKDQWISTGSSIVESTRIDDVERIYMLFGKLGGKPAFKCRPYQDVLCEIAVTHAPRYLINMAGFVV